MIDVFGKGVYAVSEAASLTKLPASRIREWFSVRNSDARPAVFSSDYPRIERGISISFLDLIDVFVAGQLRTFGVSMQTVRRVYQQLQHDLRANHAFCRKELLTDGKSIFTRGLDTQGREEIVDALTRQRVFPRIIRPFLKRITYHSSTNLATRWQISKTVVVDPTICFGQPIVEAAGIPASILAAAYQSNQQDAFSVAEWYGVAPHHVLAAVEFENSIAA
jgi:uncharacterized protein (DUF433 family)